MRKFALAFAAWLLCCGYTFTNLGTATNTGSGSTVTITGVTVGAGSVIVVCAAESGGQGSSSVSDSAGNVYRTNNSGGGSTLNGILYFATNVSALSSGTITYTKGGGNGDYVAVSALAITGSTMQLVKDASASNTASGTSTNPNTSVNTSTNNEALVACVAGANGGTLTNPTGWSTPFNASGEVNNGTNFAQANGGSQTSTSAPGGVSYSATYSSSTSWITMVQGFIPSGGTFPVGFQNIP